MNDTALLDYINGHFADIQVVTADDNSFIYYGPEGKVPEKTFPFATLVTNDAYDAVSNLGRPGVYRLNVGVSSATCPRRTIHRPPRTLPHWIASCPIRSTDTWDGSAF